MCVPQLGYPFLNSFLETARIKRIVQAARPLDPNVNHPSVRKDARQVSDNRPNVNHPSVRKDARQVSDNRRSSAAVDMVSVYNKSTGGNILVPGDDSNLESSHRYDMSEIEKAFMLV